MRHHMLLSDDIAKIVTEDIGVKRGGLLLVAMSGGVDSSTVAVLLHLLGYKVIGVTLNLYSASEEQAPSKACCGSRDIRDAKSVAAKFGFPHYVLDYRGRFRSAVIDKFVESYNMGLTPVPCILCNQTVKFDDLLSLARSIDAEALVTGHYVRRKVMGSKPVMLEALDASKDQSYFLGFTTLEQLSFLRFPLGDFTKNKIREIAKNIGIPVHDKPDSQDICFVGSGNYRDFVSQHQIAQAGDIIDMNGNIVGSHRGVHNFTVGQRRGITSGAYHDKPLYVVNIDTSNNRITVGPKACLMSRRVAIGDINWIDMPDDAVNIDVKLRSSQKRAAASIEHIAQNSAELELATPYFAVAPGQACVMYMGQTVLGSGFIKRGGH